MTCEGIYRMSGVKSKVQQLRACYNRHEPVCLSEHGPHVVASLLKQFLRELPDPVLTSELSPKFEDAAGKQSTVCITCFKLYKSFFALLRYSEHMVLIVLAYSYI